MNQLPHRSRRPFVILMASLGVWTVLLAIGAFLYGYRQDVRKPLIVIGAMFVFLGGWMVLLLIRATRNSAQNQARESSEITHDDPRSQTPTDSSQHSSSDGSS